MKVLLFVKKHSRMFVVGTVALVLISLLVAGVVYRFGNRKKQKNETVLLIVPKPRPEIPDDHVPRSPLAKSDNLNGGVVVSKPLSEVVGVGGRNEAVLKKDQVKANGEPMGLKSRKRLEYPEYVTTPKSNPIMSDPIVPSSNVTVTTSTNATASNTTAITNVNANTPSINPALPNCPIPVQQPNMQPIPLSPSLPVSPLTTLVPPPPAAAPTSATAPNSTQPLIMDPLIPQKYSPLPTTLPIIPEYKVIKSLDQDIFLAQTTSSDPNQAPALSLSDPKETTPVKYYLGMKLNYAVEEGEYLVRKLPIRGLLVPECKSECGRLLFFSIDYLPPPPSTTSPKPPKSAVALPMLSKTPPPSPEKLKEGRGVQVVDECMIKTSRKVLFRRALLDALTFFLSENTRLDDQQPIRLVQVPTPKGGKQIFIMGLVQERLRMSEEEEYKGLYRILFQLYPNEEDAEYVLQYFTSEAFLDKPMPPSDHYVNIK